MNVDTHIDGVNIPITYIPCNPSNYGGGRPLSAIKYIVIHYTANDWDSDTSNGNYFKNNVVKASANYFVDTDSICISVPDNVYAWHCGGGLQGSGGHQWHNICNNWNSIGIEICDNTKDGRVMPTESALHNAQVLTAALMKKYDIPIENVIRHWDVTGKICPAYFVGDENTSTGKAWIAWKNELEEMTMERYKSISEVPSSIKSEVQEVMDLGALKGNGEKGIDMTYNELRVIVICLRLIKKLLGK